MPHRLIYFGDHLVLSSMNVHQEGGELTSAGFLLPIKQRSKHFFYITSFDVITYQGPEELPKGQIICTRSHYLQGMELGPLGFQVCFCPLYHFVNVLLAPETVQH